VARSPLSVLVVEDEPLVRIVVVEELELLGFAVLEADTAASARQIVEASDGELAAAVIDVGLPDARGDDLAKELRKRLPGTAFILVSGYDEETLRERFTDFDRIGFLSKPYMASDLINLLGRFGIKAAAPTASSARPAY
jgi:CheY-like chemotaxis protein